MEIKVGESTPVGNKMLKTKTGCRPLQKKLVAANSSFQEADREKWGHRGAELRSAAGKFSIQDSSSQKAAELPVYRMGCEPFHLNPQRQPVSADSWAQNKS